MVQLKIVLAITVLYTMSLAKNYVQGVDPIDDAGRASSPAGNRQSTVIKVHSSTEFDKKMANHGGKLVVVNYTASWCESCRFLNPYFKTLATKYPDAIFLEVDIDECSDAPTVNKIKSIPRFVCYRDTKRIDLVIGARKDKLDSMIRKQIAQEEDGTNFTATLVDKNRSECVNCASNRDNERFIKFSETTDTHLKSDSKDPRFAMSSTVIKVHSSTEFDKKMANNSGKLVVVNYTASWCESCRFLDPYFKTLATKYPGATFLEVDIDECSDAPTVNKIKSVPRFVCYRDMKQIDLVANGHKEKIDTMIRVQMAQEKDGTNLTAVFLDKSQSECVNCCSNRDNERLIKFSENTDTHLKSDSNDPRLAMSSTVIEIRSGAEFYEKMANHGRKLAVVYYTASWCESCQFLASYFKTLATKYSNVTFLVVDIEKCSDAPTVENIKSIPRFICYRDTKQIDRVIGAGKGKLDTIIRTQMAREKDHTDVKSRSEYLNYASNRDNERFIKFLENADTHLESHFDDPRLIMSISFTQTAKLHSLKIKAPKSNGPKTIKLYANQMGTVNFDNVEGDNVISPKQTLELKPEDLNGKSIPFIGAKFSQVSNLQIFIESNQSASGTGVTRIDNLVVIGSPI